MKILLALALTTACGTAGTRISGKLPDCNKSGLKFTTNCSTPGTAPTPIPTAPPATLTLTGPSPAPSGALYVSSGFARVPGSSLTGWQSFGLSNATTPVVKVFGTSMNASGKCQQVDTKMIVTTGPSSTQGTFYNQTNLNRFRYCVENGDVIVGFEDGVDNNFADFKIRIHSNLGNLNYKVVGSNLFVCLD